MKVLIIGGTRFLGYHIVRRLLEDSHEVTLFNRGLTPDDFGGRVKRIRGDRYDHKDFYRRFKGKRFDVVVDMIAFKVEDTRAAVRTFEGNIGHFIHISTGAVYIVTKDFPCPLREDDFDRELGSPSKKNAGLWEYGFHKRKCEEVLQEAYGSSGFPVMSLRLPVVQGERDYTLRAYSYFIRLQDGNPLILPDSGLNVATHVYQGDIVHAVALNLLNKRTFGQAYNLAQEEVLSLRGFVLKAAEVLGRTAELVDIPSSFLDEISLGTDFSPFSGRRPFILSVEKARKDLQMTSTPLATWLRKTILWFNEEYQGDPPENYQSRDREVKVARCFQEILKSAR
ncbi:MAG: NAD-dependent epimerase/dehydratase family protein [Candidatus Aminicenantales bacterium]